jgi:hypothetical protein
MPHYLRKTAFAVSSILLLCPELGAQQLTGSIFETVADKSGSPIAGATVQLVSETMGSSRHAATDAEGAFQLQAVAAGMYRIAAKHPGFKAYECREIELTANQSLALGELRLELGDVSESVTVRAEGAAVPTATGERSGVITSEEVENLTVMNRDFATLVALMPGVVDNPGTSEVQGFSEGASFNVGGNRSNLNSITLDGGSIENSNGGNGNNFVSMDSIQSVRIVTSNYQAEFGRKPGAGIMAITKSGGQQYHGAAYEYYRHEWMNADEFFNNRQGLPKTPRRVQSPGFNIGGPVYIPELYHPGKEKLFFFASLEFIH